MTHFLHGFMDGLTLAEHVFAAVGLLYTSRNLAHWLARKLA